jgi:hypothetical protein
VFLLGILFRHRAFQATRLASCRDIERLDIHPGELELPLPLRLELDDTFVFRRAIKMVTGYEMSATERITYGMIAGWIKAIGVIMGMEYSTIAYSLRYNAANGLDQSRMCLSFLLFVSYHSQSCLLLPFTSDFVLSFFFLSLLFI